MFYIGYSTVSNIDNGYRGSVSSQLYKDIWLNELKNNPELFTTKIITTHKTKEDAMNREYNFQKALNVVVSPLYINKAFCCRAFNFGTKWTASVRDKHRILRQNKKWWNNGVKQTHSSICPDGWTRGRLPFNNSGASLGAAKVKKMVWVNDGITETMLLPEDIDNTKFVKGRLPGKHKGNNVHAKGTKWWNNGTIEKMSKECPKGFIAGRIKFSSRN